MTKKQRKRLLDWYPIDPKRYPWDKMARGMALEGTPLRYVSQAVKVKFGLDWSPARVGSRLLQMGIWVSEQRAERDKRLAAETQESVTKAVDKETWDFRQPGQLQQQMKTHGRKMFMRAKSLKQKRVRQLVEI